ncbi:MAG: DUF58 domain-containing protein [Phycisphaerales bacterium]|nr:DUF58 domain-containing protein [Phycisphaerales bacterium]
MRIRPTLLGWKAMSLLAALTLAFFATAYSNLFFLLVATCGALGGLGAVVGAANLRGVAVLGCELPLAAAGERRAVAVRLTAPKPRFDLRVALALAEDGAAPAPVGVCAMVAGPTTLAGELQPRDRGVATVRAVRIASSWPFGLFTASRDVPFAGELTTYPAPAGDARQAAVVAGGRAAGGARDASVAGLRPFRAGDSVTDVHWKATARRGAPVVKERDVEAPLADATVVDRRLPPAAFATALAGAAADVLEHARLGMPLQLRSQGTRLALNGRRDGAAALLRWLAAAAPLPADAGPPQETAS